MKIIQRLVCLLLALLLLPLPALAEQTGQEAPAPNIRVLLRRLNLGQQANLILDGVYTAGTGEAPTMAFPQGSQITVQIVEDQLYLLYEGMSMLLGDEVQLWRSDDGTERLTGLRFERNGNLYPGSLRLSIADGQLQPVLTISLEEYLLGVVPYEMSESFPVEALKAQAVCARTYALAHVSPGREWDVVDTTNDQVFKGVNLNYTNAIRAVRETAGVVGFYDDALATCYYGASNGGQTELVQNVWSGRGDWSYYAMVDDPYDLENPESMLRRARLRKDGTGLKAEFIALVTEAMQAEMLRQGYETGEDMLRIDSIRSVSLGAPGFDPPSRYMTEMTLTFTWSGRKRLDNLPQTSVAPTVQADADGELYLFATPTPAPTPALTPAPTAQTTADMPTATPEVILSDFLPAREEATLTLALFPDVIRSLGLSISGSDNELVTVAEEEAAFVIEARRYGHGVGMSQRGAQWMAGEYGKQYYEILQFYYPGMELRRAQAGAPVLPTVPRALSATPAPPPTPTPRPTLMPVTATELPQGVYLASVENIDDDSSLNLRMEPTTASGIIRRLYKHQQLVVLETCEDPEWVHVRTDVVEGYVMVKFLEIILP